MLNHLTVTQAAAQLGCSGMTVRRYIESGRLTATKVGNHMWLIDSESVDSLKPPRRGRPPAQKVKETE